MKLVLFDLDGTLIPRDSDHAFGEFIVGLGWADPETFRQRNDGFYQDYLAGQLDIAAYVDFATAPWRARSEAELQQATEHFLLTVVQPMLTPAALALVEGHQRAGDEIAIITATNDFVTRPIARLLGVDALIATTLERDASGRVTGRIAGMPSFREGKVTRLHEWLADRGQALTAFESCTFYSDSINDLPLLEHVSHPVATNPGPALERIAQERGWPVLKLFA
jgi:HAD superfamily hydrolase (TIGR01490 family)